MQIINLDDKWGQARLLAEATWPEATRRERERLYDQVVDAFHRRVKEVEELDVQWLPEVRELVVRQGDMPEMAELEAMLEAAYAEVAGAWV